MRRPVAAKIALVRAGILSVSEIFQRLGYASAAAFNRAFKRKYRVPPSAFRRDVGTAELKAS